MFVLEPSDAKLFASPQLREMLRPDTTRNEHHMQELYGRRLLNAEMMALETYHTLAWMLQAYPGIESAKAIWLPEVEAFERTLIVRFRLELKIKGDPAIPGLYGYDECPEILGNPEAYDRMIEAGENVGPEIWNEFLIYGIATRTAPYTSVQEVAEDMGKDLTGALAAISRLKIEQTTDPAVLAARPVPRI